jgi:ketosteroid isomerase-like protein
MVLLDAERTADPPLLEHPHRLGPCGPTPPFEERERRLRTMSNENVKLVRGGYEAHAHGDTRSMLRFIDPDLEWTYLDPGEEDPEPQVCHGHELEVALERQTEQGLKAELEEVIGNGDRVMVVVRIPGVDAYRVRQTDDQSFLVMTVREGRIVAVSDCRDRQEAFAIVGGFEVLRIDRDDFRLYLLRP